MHCHCHPRKTHSTGCVFHAEHNSRTWTGIAQYSQYSRISQTNTVRLLLAAKWPSPHPLPTIYVPAMSIVNMRIADSVHSGSVAVAVRNNGDDGGGTNDAACGNGLIISSLGHIECPGDEVDHLYLILYGCVCELEVHRNDVNHVHSCGDTNFIEFRRHVVSDFDGLGFFESSDFHYWIDATCIVCLGKRVRRSIVSSLCAKRPIMANKLAFVWMELNSILATHSCVCPFDRGYSVAHLVTKYIYNITECALCFSPPEQNRLLVAVLRRRRAQIG